MVSCSHSVPRRSEAKTVQRLFITIIIAIATTVLNANAQEGYTQNGYIYVGTGNLGKYRLDGSTVNASLISGVGGQGLAISGTNIYVSNNNHIGKYSTSGKTNNASLITKPTAYFYGIAVAGTNLFVPDFNGGTVSEYSTSGTLINNNYYPLLGQPAVLAISGNDGRVFVGYNSGFAGRGAIATVTTNGFDPNFITNLDLPTGLAFSGTNIFVSDYGSNKIGEYTTSGQTINASLITGLKNPAGIAILGTNLFVANNSGGVSEYSTSGLLINPAFITVPNPWALAIDLVPRLNAAPAPAIGNQIALYYPTWATNYVVQVASNLTSSAWANITNGTPMTCVLVPNTPSAGGVATAYRLVPAQ